MHITAITPVFFSVRPFLARLAVLAALFVAGTLFAQPSAGVIEGRELSR